MPEYDVVGKTAPARFERANASVKEMCLKPLDDGAKTNQSRRISLYSDNCGDQIRTGVSWA